MIRILPLIFVLLGYSLTSAMGRPAVECPNIKLIEPQGVIATGDAADFRLEPDPKQEVEWTASFGIIEKGQGTASISVRTSMANNLQTMKVEAGIKGLPKDCAANFEGSARVVCCIDYDSLLDEYGEIPANDQRGRLDAALTELLKNPDQKGYFILRSKKGTTEKQLLARVKLMKDHIFGRRKFPGDRIVILSDSKPHFENDVRIYRVPSRLGSSICSTCRTH